MSVARFYYLSGQGLLRCKWRSYKPWLELNVIITRITNTLCGTAEEIGPFALILFLIGAKILAIND